MHLTRRRFVSTASLAATATLIQLQDPRSLYAQSTPALPDRLIQARQMAASAKITTQNLRGNVSVLLGSGGNIAVLPAKEGLLLVDSGMSTSRPRIAESLAAISPGPIRILVNTHWHYDHTDGNKWMHSTGANIWAHENTRMRMASTQNMAAFHAVFPPSPTGALPTVLFNSSKKISDETSNVLLTHYDPAHTDTDLSVYFQEADVLHAGDTWFNSFYPFIDYSTGGNIDGMIAATKINLATGTADTIVIPGHGPIGNKTQLTATLDMLTTVRGNVANLKKQGKSLEETIAAKPTAAFDDHWGKGPMNPPAFIGLVYQGV